MNTCQSQPAATQPRPYRPVGRLGRRVTIAALLAATTLVLCAGCESTPRERRIIARRAASFDHTLAVIEKSEQRRGPRLERTWRAIDRSINRDADRTARNPAKVDRLLDRDVKRWHENEPIWQQRIADMLAGKPERIGGNALIMWY